MWIDFCSWCATTSKCVMQEHQSRHPECKRCCALDFFQNLTPAEKGIGGGVIAAIVIGVVGIVIAAVGGKKGYDF
jgi:hypothetical protein